MLLNKAEHTNYKKNDLFICINCFIMSSLNAGPNCGREVEEGLSSNFFPVLTCRDCGSKFCFECGAEDGSTCPNCGSTEYSEYDKVYPD